MELAGFIALAHQEPPLRFVVIGGFAVAAHGHARATFDVDFLVPRAEAENWRARIAGTGMRAIVQTNAFMQFESNDGGSPLDLMLVDDRTFEEIWHLSQETDFGGAKARVPSLDHLLALKLHVLKQAQPHRTSKDAEDVEMLARRNKLDLSDARYEALFLKYGTQEIYDTFLRIMRRL